MCLGLGYLLSMTIEAMRFRLHYLVKIMKIRVMQWSNLPIEAAKLLSLHIFKVMHGTYQLK